LKQQVLKRPKALRAALEMQREFSEIKQEWQRLNYALDLLIIG